MNAPRYAFLDHPGPIAFTHRGGALENPENTWASFTHACDLGYHFMETDVHATRDGVVVTIHDPDLARTGERPGLVRDMSVKELSQVRLTGEGDLRVPRLDELLEAWPEVRWNIDAKHDSVVDPLIDTVRHAGAIDRVCFTSFNDRRLLRLRRALGPKACTAMGPIGTTAMRLASVVPGRAGQLAAGRLHGWGAAQVPVRQGRIPLVDRRFLAACHGAGLQVHVWTVDDSVTMDRLLELGVDGLMTDRPTALKEVLIRRNVWI